MADYDYTDLNTTWCPGQGQQPRPGHCAVFYDSLLCWPETKANSYASNPCPNYNDSDIYKAFRYCPHNGTWDDVKTDYAMCLQDNTVSEIDLDNLRIAEALKDIYFTLSSVSLVLLLVTIFIFTYFRSLQCSRISIHKHLVVSFIFQFIIIIIMTEPYITMRQSSYRDVDWLCKTLTALSQYLILASMFWMLVEGFFLHHSLVLGVFSTQPPFKLFYAIGWGLPGAIVTSWGLALHFTHETKCWQNYSQLHTFYIITIPFTLVIVVNLIFLVNIIRVLVSKLRANNRVESANIRKAIKATVILMPLLGLTNLLFFISPGEDNTFQPAYQITNAVLRSSQGIFVAILYCFLNGEVRRVIKQKWYRFKIRYVMHHPSGRRRSSRTSSFFLPTATEEEESSRSQHSPAGEQHRLLQANKGLKLDNNLTTIPEINHEINHVTLKENNHVTVSENNHVIFNGAVNANNSDLLMKKNNNNGEVQFNIDNMDNGTYGIDVETVL